MSDLMEFLDLSTPFSGFSKIYKNSSAPFGDLSTPFSGFHDAYPSDLEACEYYLSTPFSGFQSELWLPNTYRDTHTLSTPFSGFYG